MNITKLERVVRNLEESLGILAEAGIQDTRIRNRYAELLAAYILASKGFEVQIGAERKNRNADLYLPIIKKRIEVKSGLYIPRGENPRTCDASFGKGTQISKKKFDFCVFMTFDGSTPQEKFVFNRSELSEVTQPRPKMAKFANNSCMLLYHSEYDAYSRYLNRYGEPEYEIEKELHQNPEKFNERWDIIS